VVAYLFHAGRMPNGQRDMTKLIVGIAIFGTLLKTDTHFTLENLRKSIIFNGHMAAFCCVVAVSSGKMVDVNSRS
jgi:hypothetical protein